LYSSENYGKDSDSDEYAVDSGEEEWYSMLDFLRNIFFGCSVFQPSVEVRQTNTMELGIFVSKQGGASLLDIYDDVFGTLELISEEFFDILQIAGYKGLFTQWNKNTRNIVWSCSSYKYRREFEFEVQALR
jgi:hypothetical protein